MSFLYARNKRNTFYINFRLREVRMNQDIKILDIRKCNSGDCHCCFCIQRTYCDNGCKNCKGRPGDEKDNCDGTIKVQAAKKKRYNDHKKTS